MRVGRAARGAPREKPETEGKHLREEMVIEEKMQSGGLTWYWKEADVSPDAHATSCSQASLSLPRALSPHLDPP